jgi:spore maturation protein SpmB
VAQSWLAGWQRATRSRYPAATPAPPIMLSLWSDVKREACYAVLDRAENLALPWREQVLQSLLQVILESGKSAVDLTLYVLLPVMVVMMAVMKLLEAKGVLAFITKHMAPVLRPFGIPGIGVFAILQVLLVSFNAPAATLHLMNKEGTPRRGIAATLAMVLAMSQANAVFPMLVVGLNLHITLLTSLVGGLTAAAVTHYVFRWSADIEVRQSDAAAAQPDRPPARVLDLLRKGGYKGVQLSLQSIPMLVLAIFLVKALEASGAIAFLEKGLTPLLARVGLPGIAVLPIATKYLAGGTAMMGVALNLVKQGSMSALDLNRITGFMINPLDLVGFSALVTAVPRVKEIAWQALTGAAVGIFIRGLLHMLLF